MDSIRIDKWLWTMRIFKTRSIAAEACKKGRISIDGASIKPAREISVGAKVTVRKPPIMHTYKIIQISKSRLSAKLVPDYMKDLTPTEELDKLNVNEAINIKRERGTGRPTKKERRLIDRLQKDN